MPLYELIVITKCTPPAISAALLRNATKFIWGRGGNVRDVRILSDRLLAKEMIATDREPTLIGRYTQILFDGAPSMMPSLTRELKLDKSVLKVSYFKVKDFYCHAQEYNKPVDSLIKQTNPKDETARKIALLQSEGH